MIRYAAIVLFTIATLGGIIAGLVGIGGGVIYVFLYESYFQYFYDVKDFTHNDTIVKAVIANSIFSTMFAGFTGAWKNYTMGHFNPKIISIMGLPAVGAALLITYLLSITHVYSLQSFTIVFAFVLLPFIVRVLIKRESANYSTLQPSNIGLILTGLISGSVTALTGLGGGVVMIPALNGILKFPLRKTIAASLGVIGLVSLGLTIYNIFFQTYEVEQFMYATGFIVYPMAIPAVLGVMIGARWGVQWGQKIPEFWLKVIFVTATLCILGNLFYDAFI